jgi:hypothetical protein
MLREQISPTLRPSKTALSSLGDHADRRFVIAAGGHVR